ncbi:hypothetical protein ACFMJY_19350, partial [Acinetobacter baumannii]
MKNIKTLILAMSTISLTAVVMPAHAATDAEVDALRKEVSELKQLVQQLSNLPITFKADINNLMNKAYWGMPKLSNL